MSEQAKHTEGRLQLGFDDGSGAVATDSEGVYLTVKGRRYRSKNGGEWHHIVVRGGEFEGIPIGVVGDTPEQGTANARRIVALWNALEGIPTADIEKAAGIEDEWDRFVYVARLAMDKLKEINDAIRADLSAPNADEVK